MLFRTSIKGENEMNKATEKLQKALKLAEEGEWDAANKLLNGHGVEYISCDRYELKYINLGDAYSTTVCQEKFEMPFLGSWGNWAKEMLRWVYGVEVKDDTDILKHLSKKEIRKLICLVPNEGGKL